MILLQGEISCWPSLGRKGYDDHCLNYPLGHHTSLDDLPFCKLLAAFRKFEVDHKTKS